MTSPLAPMDDPHRLLLLQEVADQRGTTPARTYSDARAGRLATLRLGGGRNSYRVLQPDLAAAFERMPETLSVLDVAAFLRTSTSTVLRLLESGRLPHMIRREDLREFVLGASSPRS